MPAVRKIQRATLVALVVVAACVGRAAAEELLVFAAASMQESLTAAADAYGAQGSAAPLLSFGATSSLARQIEYGARAGLFLSADEPWMDYLGERGRIVADTRVALLGNELVLIAPASRPFELQIRPGFDLGAILGDERLAMADPDSVPAGRYGRAALESLGVWPGVERNVARVADVRGALALVERDEVRAGIVYRTDLAASNGVTVAGVFPADSHAPIVYALAVVAGNDTPAARHFRDFLLSPAGMQVFRKFGFPAP